MARSMAFDRLARAVRIALFCEREGISTAEGMERVAQMEARSWSRREILADAGRLAAVGAIASLGWPARRALARPGPSIDVGIVGAGLAGLACAYTLQGKGVAASLYDANDRVGGRQWSMRNFHGGQAIERGGELIDNLHKTLLGWINEFGLEKEDLSKAPGEVFYYFGGNRVPEPIIVDEYRAFVAAMGDSLRSLSGDPNFENTGGENVSLDQTDLASYLTSRGAGGNLYKAIEEAYEAEYGLSLDKQSSLNFLLFIHKDKRSKFTPFGVFSDERYHVIGGNDQIASGLHDRLAASSKAQLGMRLLKVKRLTDGRIELTFKKGGPTVTKVHEAVVLAIPFTLLRGVEIDADVSGDGFSDSQKRNAIDNLGYGTNSKQMIAFKTPFWRALGGNGATYADLASAQATWETNHSRAKVESSPGAGDGSGIMTDYGSAQRGATIDPGKAQQEAQAFLSAIDVANYLPGANAHVAKSGGKIVNHIENWTKNPLSLGSYTCYKPGQFTTIADLEGKASGNILFAGEHANSFYVWQGFMEGAALSGIDAANAALALAKK